MRLACCTCLMNQGAILVGQGLVRMALAQMQFGLPHLVERRLEQQPRLRIEQGRRLRLVMRVAVFLENVVASPVTAGFAIRRSPSSCSSVDAAAVDFAPSRSAAAPLPRSDSSPRNCP